MYLKAAARIFKKNFALNIFIIIELAISMFFLNSIFIFSFNQNYEQNISKKLLQENFYVLSGQNSSGVGSNAFTDATKNLKEKYKGYLEFGEAAKILDFDTAKSNVQALAYSESISKYIQIPLAKGTWYDSKPTQNDAINVVATSDIGNVGDFIDCTIDNKPSKLKITGILPQSFAYLNFKGGISGFADMFEWRTPKNADSIIIGSMSNFESSPSLYYGSVNIPIINKTASESLQKEIVHQLSLLGGVMDKATLLQNSKIEESVSVGVITPIIVILLVIGVLNFILISALSVKKNLRDAAIIFLCGGKKCDNIIIIGLYAFIISFFSVILTTILTNVLGVTFIAKCIITNGYLTFATMAVPTALFIGTSIILSLCLLKQKNIATILKQDDQSC